GICAAGDAAKVLTYDTDVKPILRARCFKCHGDDEKKDGLSLASYQELMKGGSSGEIVKAGRAAGRILFQAVAHQGDGTPMPPKSPKIPDNEIDIIRNWIDQGIVEAPGGAAKGQPKRATEFKSSAKFDGPPPMPEKFPAANLPEIKKHNSITAIAT